jgi:hypothetical protein
MLSDLKTIQVYAPGYPVWDTGSPSTAIGDVKKDTSGGIVSLTLKQNTTTLPNGITYNALSPTAATLLTKGITAALASDTYTFSIAQNTVITPALTITASATNGVSRTITSAFTIECGRPPVINAPSSWTPAADTGTTFYVDSTSAKTIVASFSSDLPLTTVSVSTLDTGITKTGNTQTTCTFTIAQYADFAGTYTLSIGSVISGTNYITQSFTVGASAIPALGNASQTGVIETTSAKTITVTAASTPNSKITSWGINPALPSGVTGSGTTGQTSPSGQVYTISIPANTSFASASYTVTAYTGVAQNTGTKTFSFSANVKPVVNGIGSSSTYDTTSARTYTRATLSTNTSGYTWSISPSGYGVTIDANGYIYVAAGSKFGSTSFTVTATTSDVGSGSTSFSLACNVIPVVGNQSYTLNTQPGTQYFNFGQSSSGTGISWSYSALPANVGYSTANDSYIQFYVGQNQRASGAFSVTASNNGGSASATVTVNAAPPPPPPPYVPPYTPPYGGIGR